MAIIVGICWSSIFNVFLKNLVLWRLTDNNSVARQKKMFKKFESDLVSSTTQLKSSVVRNLKASLSTQLLLDSEQLETILPKKSVLFQLKTLDALLYTMDDCLILLGYEGKYFPMLKLIHQYPNCLPKVQVDRGAIKHVLKGADIMCPGLTSMGGDLPVELGENTPVAIYAEGKQHALAVGLLRMSTQDIKQINKGVAIQNLHYLGDGLWSR
jgi:PUA domain protein